MKKLFLTTILVCAGLIGVYAQTGEEEAFNVKKSSGSASILPEEGDFSLSISADPLWNIFSSGGNYGPVFGGANFTNGFKNPSIGIIGQYFLDDETSVRVKINFSFGSDVYKQTVTDDYAFQQPGYNGQTVVDVKKVNRNYIDLAAGYVLHRGDDRLQGYFGGELGVSFDNGKTSYTWANPITEANPTPSSGFGENGNPSRTIERKTGNALGVFAGGFIGAEFFFAPKMSIGGEVGVAINAFNRWQGTTTKEGWDERTGVVQENSVRDFNGNEKSGGWGVRVVPSGKLMLSFYF